MLGLRLAEGIDWALLRSPLVAARVEELLAAQKLARRGEARRGDGFPGDGFPGDGFYVPSLSVATVDAVTAYLAQEL